jgi:hypothetical protein
MKGKMRVDGIDRLDSQRLESRTYVEGVCDVLEERVEMVGERENFGEIPTQREHRLLENSCCSLV